MTRRSGLGFAGIMLGMSTSVLMQTLIATSLPTIVGELGGMQLYSWVFGAYMLASTVTIPLFSRLADLMGRRTLYLGGLVVFVAGTLLAGMVGSMPQLVAVRAFQGLGAGAVAPAALAAIGDLFGPERQGRAFGMIGAVQVLANLAGPTLGGWATDHLGWRWGFFLVVPVGVLAGLFAAPGLPTRPFPGLKVLRGLDWPGAVLVGGSLAAGLLGLQALGTGLTAPAPAIGALVVAALLFAAGFTLERRHPDPALPLALLRQAPLRQAVLGALLLGAVSQGAIAYIPLYVKGAGEQAATGAGIALLPMLLMAGAGSAIGGQLERRHPRLVAGAAWLLTFAAMGALAGLRPGAGSPLLLTVAALIGLGMGLLMPHLLGTAQRVAGESHRAASAGAIQLARNLGGAISVPLLGIWLIAGGLPSIFATLAAVAALGLLTIRRPSTVVGGA